MRQRLAADERNKKPGKYKLNKGHTMTWLWLIFVHVLVTLDTVPVDGKVVQGSLNTKEDWHFITRFCFMSKKGGFKFEIVYPKDYATQKLLLYYDDTDQWPAAYKTDPEKNCTAKHAILHPENGQVITLDTPDPCEEVVKDGQTVYKCVDTRGFVSARDRWWYFAVDNCDSEKGLKLAYNLTMYNGDEGDFLRRHLSADEFDIFETDIGFLVVNVVVFILSCYVSVTLKKMNSLTSTYMMYMTSLVCQILHLIFMILSYGIYMTNGEEQKGLTIMGRLLEDAGSLIFLLLLVLLAKGYTVTRGRLRSESTVKISVYMTIFIVSYIVMYIWNQYVADPGKVLYIYESPPGYFLIALKLLGFVWFLYAVLFTVKHFPGKTGFYIYFTTFFSAWFVIVPVFILITTFALSKHARAKTVNGVQLTITFCSHFAFLFLTRPSSANENFPFHVKSCQTNVDPQSSEIYSCGADYDIFRASAYVMTERVPSESGYEPQEMETSSDKTQDGPPPYSRYN